MRTYYKIVSNKPKIYGRDKQIVSDLNNFAISAGMNISDIGTSNNSSIGIAAAYLGAHYTGFEIREEMHTSILRHLDLYELGSFNGNYRPIHGEFSSGPNSLSTRILSDNIQDIINGLTGVFSDPSPESDRAQVLVEMLRVIKPNGRIFIGSFNWMPDEMKDCYYFLKGMFSEEKLAECTEVSVTLENSFLFFENKFPSYEGFVLRINKTNSRIASILDLSKYESIRQQQHRRYLQDLLS